MLVGLGTGSTARYFLAALAGRSLDLLCVATSPATDGRPAGSACVVESFDSETRLERLDIAVDGADQSPRMLVVKGGGAAHTREKIVAAAADRFVVIASRTSSSSDWASPARAARLGLDATFAAWTRRFATPPRARRRRDRRLVGPVTTRRARRAARCDPRCRRARALPAGARLRDLDRPRRRG